MRTFIDKKILFIFLNYDDRKKLLGGSYLAETCARNRELQITCLPEDVVFIAKNNIATDKIKDVFQRHDPVMKLSQQGNLDLCISAFDIADDRCGVLQWNGAPYVPESCERMIGQVVVFMPTASTQDGYQLHECYKEYHKRTLMAA